jgi:methionyl aminopeptidase
MIKTKKEIEIMREGGKRLAEILRNIVQSVEPGVSTAELNEEAEKLVRDGGDEPAFLNYTPRGAPRPYPATLCVSINDEIVHGIPNEDPQVLREGDIVGLDLGLKHKGMVVDSAVTVPVGEIDESAQKLINTTRKALSVGIKTARAGNTVGDIGYAIEQFVKPFGYGIPRELGGHGIGCHVSEEPYIPNYGKRGEGEKLKAGMVLALEPMLNEGTERIIESKGDGYTLSTADGKRSAHFEHTILITEGDAEILTKRV